MAANTLNNQAQGLLTLYTRLFENKYGYKPAINRYAHKYAMRDMIDQYGYERAKQIVEHYFNMSKQGHHIDWLLYNYEKIEEILQDIEKDNIERARIRMETKARVERFKLEQSRTRTNSSSNEEQRHPGGDAGD